MQYITTTELSAVFGFHPQTMRNWPDELRPREVMVGRHRYEDVNAWLAEPGRVFGFVKPPTIERILSGEITFVRRGAATRMLMEVFASKDPARFVLWYIRSGRLRALRLRHQSWLISLDSIERLISEHRARPEGFGLQEVYQICGFGMSVVDGKLEMSSTLWKLRRAGELELFKEDVGERLRVRHRSFVAFVQKSLCETSPPIDADDWIDDRLHSTKPLLSVAEAAAQLGFPEVHLHLMISKGEIHAIRSPAGKKLYVSPESVDVYQAGMSVLKAREIAKVFGVNRRAVTSWWFDGLLVCPLHGHDCRFYRWCLVAYVAQRVGNGTPAVRWVHNVLSEKGRRILSEKAILGKILTAKQLRLGVEAGRIWSITAPNGRRVFTATTVLKEAKRYESWRRGR